MISLFLPLSLSLSRDDAQKVLNRADAVQKYLDEAAVDQAETRATNEQILRELDGSKSEIADVRFVPMRTCEKEDTSSFAPA